MQTILLRPLRTAIARRNCDAFLRSVEEIPSIFVREHKPRIPCRYASQTAVHKSSAQHEDPSNIYRPRSKRTESSADQIEPALKDPDAVSSSVQAAARREIVWLADPIGFSNRIRACLDKRNVPLALALLRLASKSKDVVSGWNTAVDYFSARGEIMNAVRVYNEMKKRQQFPDARTYTLLFRGLVRCAKHKDALPRALSIYHSMDAPGSKIKPNIIHTNAVLEICARAYDPDALWGIIGKMPDQGPGAADQFTYTTILKSLRWEAIRDGNSNKFNRGLDETEHPREVAVARGRNLWFLIAKRWRMLGLQMDESLMNAMSELLLMSSRSSNWDDVLSLIAQVTGVPRQLERIPDSSVPQVSAAADDGLIVLEPGILPKTVDMRLPPSGRNDSVNPFTEQSFEKNHSRRRTPSAVRIEPRDVLVPATGTLRPGNKTLTCALGACLQIDVMHPNLGALAAGRAYWELLTKPNGAYRIEPDELSLYAYLRILRRNKAGRETVKVLTDHKEILDPKVFKIALPACARNATDPNSLVHALKVYEMMMERAERPDYPRIQVFANLLARCLGSNMKHLDYHRALEVLLKGVPVLEGRKPTLANQPIVEMLNQFNRRGLRPLELEEALASAGTISRVLVGIIDSLERLPRQQGLNPDFDLKENRRKLSRLVEKFKEYEYDTSNVRGVRRQKLAQVSDQNPHFIDVWTPRERDERMH